MKKQQLQEKTYPTQSERERVTYLENNGLKFCDFHLAFDGGPEFQTRKNENPKEVFKKKKKAQKTKGCLRKGKGIAITYHEEEHRVSNSASHSEQSCRNSYAQRPPLLEALWVFDFESE